MSDHLKVLSEMLGIPTLALEQMITAQKHEKTLCDAYGLKDLSELNRLTKLDKQAQQAAAIGWLESQTVPKLASRGYVVGATKYSAPVAYAKETQLQIDKITFRKLCPADNYENFSGFRLRGDGLHLIKKLDAAIDKGVFDDDSKEILNDYSGHALEFPCSLTKLRAFVEDAGLAGCIDEDAVAELLAKPPEVNPSSVSDAGQAAAEPLQIQTNKKTPKIRDKGLRQIEAIVAELERLGYKPLRLPALVAGQRSAKAEVVDNLDRKGLFTARKAFDNAWQEATRRSYIKNEN